ncbi:MAG: hypothetical protein DRO06_05065 [Thermoproteota archaeon]|nr:MAG: hypothetical protein DRO06_05065 [Candidatus Korarchaeota archaeon]
MTLSEMLRRYRAMAEEAVSRLLDAKKGSVFYEPLRRYVRGGKKVRPAILFAVHEACGASGDPRPAAGAVELMHAASLIHDDLIDGDSIRRGRPAYHVSNGFESAVLAADFILSIVLEVSAMYEDRRVGETLARAAREMSEGEMEEVLLLRSGEMSLSSYLRVVRKKTASLFSAASKLGALIARAGDSVVEIASRYGELVGMAYQLRDDLLDWGSDEVTSSLRPEDRGEVERLASRYSAEAARMAESLGSGPPVEFLRDIAAFASRRDF